MPLTQQSAQEAGQLAAQLGTLNTIVADLQAAIAGNASIMQMECTLAVSGSVLQAAYPFSAADSATIFNALLTIAQNDATAITNQLAGM